MASYFSFNFKLYNFITWNRFKNRPLARFHLTTHMLPFIHKETIALCRLPCHSLDFIAI
jgi:hypothetical protein